MASFVLFIPSAYPMFSMIFGRSLWVLSASEDWGMFKASSFDLKNYFNFAKIYWVFIIKIILWVCDPILYFQKR